MPNTKPPYSAEFRLETVLLVKEGGRRLSDVNRDLIVTWNPFATGFGNMEIDNREREGMDNLNQGIIAWQQEAGDLS